MTAKSSPVSKTLATGFIVGTVAGILSFLVEPIGLHLSTRLFWGKSFVWMVAAYSLTGSALGVLSALVAIPASRLLPLGRSALTISIVGYLFTALFLLRDTASSLVRQMAPGALAAVLVPLAIWIIVAVVIDRRLDRPRHGPGMATRAGVLLVTVWTVALVAWIAVGGKRLPHRAGAGVEAPNVVLVLVDALRQDHVSAYGYDRETTPTIDRIASEGVLFENAYSHGNRTILSTPCLFTSLYPSFHGAVGFKAEMAPLPESRVTIAEMLRDAGYVTMGMMSNIYLKTPFGLTQGFDALEQFNSVAYSMGVVRLLVGLGIVNKPDYASGAASPSGTTVTDRALEWLDRTSADSPYFLYVHYMDVHHAYRPPKKFEAMFHSDGAADTDPGVLFQRTVKLISTPLPIDFGADELLRLEDLYDGCIRYVDSEVARLFDALKSKSNGRETIFIFTSDHGDEFMEHGNLYHNNLVQEELIRVPLIMWSSAGRWSGRRPDLARHIDVLPTLADVVGVPAPAEAMGRSLFQPPPEGPLQTIAEGDYCAALVRDGWKIMHVDTTATELLFDLGADKWGTVNVADEYPDRYREFREALDAYLIEAEAARSSRIQRPPAEALRQLRDLGYIN